MIASLLVGVCSALSAEQSVEAFFAEFAAKREHIQSLSATFRQEERSVDEDKVSGGRIVFVKPKQLLFEYLDPKITYAIDGMRVYEYEAELEQVQAYDVEDSAQADAFFIAFDNDAGRLREAYNATLVEAGPDACGQRVLKLAPKTPASADDALAQPYKEIRLYLRQDDLLPCRMHAVVDDETSVIVDIDHYKINEANTDNSIRFHVPEGTKIIINEADVEVAGPGGKDLPVPPADAAAESERK
ncbi:MAG: outer membrane lipoprotein carrier protein LolA [Candidatus Hydrogenedentes bacterium]|nr:outer membrane lipoprotein carrier protein LolA [Candidatus Hydrogenedentota bacterium]